VALEGFNFVQLAEIPRTNMTLVQENRSEKTLMGLECIYGEIVQYNKPGLAVVFETSPTDLP
jgi:hypothetical protein